MRYGHFDTAADEYVITRPDTPESWTNCLGTRDYCVVRKFFLEHQAWPVLAGITSAERGARALDSVHKLLGSAYGLHLNWPAFRQVDDSVGFVTRVYPGVKENAAIFSHPNTWPIIAEAILGRGDRAVELYDAILPYRQNDEIEVRGAEPYAYVQFAYGRDHELYGVRRTPG